MQLSLMAPGLTSTRLCTVLHSVAPRAPLHCFSRPASAASQMAPCRPSPDHALAQRNEVGWCILLVLWRQCCKGVPRALRCARPCAGSHMLRRPPALLPQQLARLRYHRRALPLGQGQRLGELRAVGLQGVPPGLRCAVAFLAPPIRLHDRASTTQCRAVRRNLPEDKLNAG